MTSAPSAAGTPSRFLGGTLESLDAAEETRQRLIDKSHCYREVLNWLRPTRLSQTVPKFLHGGRGRGRDQARLERSGLAWLQQTVANVEDKNVSGTPTSFTQRPAGRGFTREIHDPTQTGSASGLSLEVAGSHGMIYRHLYTGGRDIMGSFIISDYCKSHKFKAPHLGKL